jgi:dTDP-4-amino-4,6-dideoxygalactose transaminase
MKKIKFLDLQKINQQYQPELSEAATKVIESGWYILGKEVLNFEKAFADYCGTKFCVGVANGLDAIRLVFLAYIETGALKKGDEVLVPANTFIATILAITDVGLKPIFIEPEMSSYNIDCSVIEEKITDKTKALILVHLYGQNAYNETISSICKTNNIILIEDAAQAHGAKYRGRKVGSLGDASCFSFYPGKNLGALGDAGAICTSNGEIFRIARALSNYGSINKYDHQFKGVNSRLDDIQAALLSIKLRYLDFDNNKRQALAKYYLENIKNPLIRLPELKENESHVWHLFVIRSMHRNELQQYLLANGIEAIIHYPIPPYRQNAYSEYKKLNLPITKKIHEEVLSLPLNPILENNEINYIVKMVNRFERNNK